jgi:hypothetical protein
MVEIDVEIKKVNNLRRIGQVAGATIPILAAGFLLRHENNIDKASLAVSIPVSIAMGSLIGGGVVGDISLFKDDVTKYLRAKKSELNALCHKLRR